MNTFNKIYDIASDKQISLVLQIEDYMGIYLEDFTKKGVWEFINENIDGLPQAKMQARMDYDYREMQKLDPRYSKFRT